MKIHHSITLLSILLSSANAFSVNNSDRRSFLQSTIATVATTTASFPLVASAEEQQVGGVKIGGKPVIGDESIMSPKTHGTSETPVQESLRYEVSNKLADKITNYNRRFAEMGVSNVQSRLFE